ncbi:RsmB/NOP family class I SAM-dependent RNA methyltransferase [Sphingomonas bacterium]|uniref:RsmB/NOP family class I SAM-dependent RNA methyltransferase n=1 Tax=Sphingomonas bacterium TaxID=1895847 RepID=UPI001575DA3C|nr:transcription antitermination factor NusB [Sphingomonas bacterium]
MVIDPPQVAAIPIVVAPVADPPGTPARRSALRLLDAVLRRGQALDAAMPGATRELPRSDDRAFAHAIAAEVLRRLPDLDALIDGATRQTLPPDAKARMALRIALVQALVLGTPPHAAIATVLPLVDGGPRKLVHGVFGTLTRAGVLLPEAPTLPEAVADRWSIAWGEDMVAAAGCAIAAPPPLDVTLRGDAPEGLGGISLAPGHRRLERGTAVTDLPGYAEGAWWVQDIAASIPARLLGTPPEPGATVLDLCAAPGGKTMQLAAAGWRTVAVDGSQSRLARLRDNLHRTRLKADVVRADLLEWSPAEPAAAVLLDAACSATGIFRRHPDVLHRARPAVIEAAATLQAQLLARAAAWVRPGGTLVYAACSLEPEEGEEQIGRFMAAHLEFEIDPVRAGELPDGIAPDPRGWVRTLPGMVAGQGGCDGFFVVRLRRAG